VTDEEKTVSAVSDDRSYTREGVDQFSAYVEERTGRGWRKLRRTLNGYQFNVYNPTTDDYIKAYLASGVDFMLNTMSDRLEIRNGDRGDRALSDIDESVLLARLLDYGMRNEGHMRKAIHTRAAQNKYHPIRQYLDSLEWDGMGHFDGLMRHLEMSSDHAVVFWRKFLVGSLAKVLDGRQNFMLVLLGAQGKGKSRLVRWLCPLPHLFNEGPISPDNKDDLILLINNWFWEVAELDSTTRRADRSALKHFVSRERVKVRVPYGRYDIDKPAAASMIGTINEDGSGFLSDPTGNRRFAVVHLDDIDWGYEKTVNRDQLWAELYTAYLNGEAYELSRAEQEVQREINASHMVQSPLEELLLEHYDIDPSQSDWHLSTMNILEQLEGLGLRGDQYRNKMELATVLNKHGLKRDRKMSGGVQVRGYVGIRFKTGVIALESQNGVF
jgi:putative DNA primase/helicase